MLSIVKKYNLNTLHSISSVQNGTLVNKKNNFFNLPQRISADLYLNGSIYIFKSKFFLKNSSLKEYPGNFFYHNEKYSLDLDDINDVKKFKLKYQYNKKTKELIIQ